MRLLVDLQGLQNNSRHRGIGRYMGALARGLLRNGAGHEINFLLNGLFPETIEQVIADFAPLVPRTAFHIFHGVGPTMALHAPDSWRCRASEILYESFVGQLQPDVLLVGSLFEGGADNSISCIVPATERRYRAATIIYDLIPLLNPDQHIGSAGARRWYFDRIAQARNADLLLAISASARREGIEHLPFDEDRIIEIGGAAAEAFTTIDPGALRGTPLAREVLAFHGINRPYLMHVSALDPRKNFEGLIDAFRALPPALRRSHQLLLVCRLHAQGLASLRAAMARNGLTDADVILAGHVPDDELRILYANCALMVFPSFHEGFGLPVVEAMWCGAPVVGSSLSSVPEVVGRADATFDPHDQHAMVDVITRALDDEAFRTSLLAHARVHSRTFSWDKVAQRALAAMASIAEPRCAPAPAPTDIDALIARIGAIPGWPGPSDSDLMRVAEAIERNEVQSWPRVVAPLRGMDMTATMC